MVETVAERLEARDRPREVIEHEPKGEVRLTSDKMAVESETPIELVAVLGEK